MRLNRFLSQCGIGSRRGCEQVIREGRVCINGTPVIELATDVKDTDKVTVDGNGVSPNRGVVVVLHKPRGYVCTRDDPEERSTIYDLLPPRYQSLHHVGRLDKDSEGLILLTNRGDLTQRLLHPSEGVEKEYEVRVDRKFNTADLPKLTHGLMTPEGFARAERAWMEGGWEVHVVLKQGLKRQIRQMLYALGYEVERLIRTRIGGLWLKGLQKGAWRELAPDEVEKWFQKRESTRPSIVKPRREKSQGSRERFRESDDDHFGSAPKKPAPAAPQKPRGFEHESPAKKPGAPRPRRPQQRGGRPGFGSKGPGGPRRSR